MSMPLVVDGYEFVVAGRGLEGYFRTSCDIGVPDTLMQTPYSLEP